MRGAWRENFMRQFKPNNHRGGTVMTEGIPLVMTAGRSGTTLAGFFCLNSSPFRAAGGGFLFKPGKGGLTMTEGIPHRPAA